MRLDALCLWRTPPLALLPACGEETGVGLTQAAAPKKNVVGTHAQGCHRRDLGRQLPEDTELLFAPFAFLCVFALTSFLCFWVHIAGRLNSYDTRYN